MEKGVKRLVVIIGLFAFLAYFSINLVPAQSCTASAAGSSCIVDTVCGSCYEEYTNALDDGENPPTYSCGCQCGYVGGSGCIDPTENNFPGCPNNVCLSPVGLVSYHDYEFSCFDNTEVCTQAIHIGGGQPINPAFCGNQIRCTNQGTGWKWYPIAQISEWPNQNKLLESLCSDGFDNDLDGFADCSDSECLNAAACACLDGDGDGFGTNSALSCPNLGFDCDDTNSDVYPNAPEICDGIENQCPGNIGYGDPIDAPIDNDGDTFNNHAGAPACLVLDCNDNDVNINPGAAEICDEIDNNCDGTIDEGCAGEICNDGSDNDGDGDRDYDSQDWTGGTPDGVHNPLFKGDNDCPVGFKVGLFGTETLVSDPMPVTDSNIFAGCYTTISSVNSVLMNIEDGVSSVACTFLGTIPLWGLSYFDCPTGSATGIKTLRCTIDTSRSFADTLAEVTTTINVVLPCAFTDAYWNQSTIKEGRPVELIVQGGLDCENKAVIFDIWEDDGGAGDDQLLPITDIYDTTIWTTIFDNEGGLDPAPESTYYFIASLETDPSVNFDSRGSSGDALLNVVKASVVGPDTDKCESYDDELQCINNPFNYSLNSGGPYDVQLPAGSGCLGRWQDLGCKWDPTCEIDSVFEYDTLNNDASCPSTNVICGFSQTVEDCSTGRNLFEIKYTSTDLGCNRPNRVLACPGSLKLPFFGWFNFISVFILVAIVYFIHNRRKINVKIDNRNRAISCSEAKLTLDVTRTS